MPRSLAILLIIFVSLFALDVFMEPQWFLALLIHLIPSFVLIALTVVAWQKERVGGVIFMIIGFLFLITSRFEGWTIALPVILTGFLFVLSVCTKIPWLQPAARQSKKTKK